MEVDPQDVRRFAKAMDDLSAMTGKTVTRLMKGATVQAAKSAAKHTRAYTPGKKRPSKKITIAQTRRGRKLREQRGIPWWAKHQIIAWRAGKPKNSQNEIILYARTDASRDKKRKIPNKGVAKRAWLFALRRLDKGVGASKPIDSIARKYNTTKLRYFSGVLQETENINTANYGVFAARGAVATAIGKTANWLQKRVEIEEQKLVRAFERKQARLMARG